MAGGEVAGALSKPVLRGLHNATIKRNLIVAGVLMVIAGVSIKVFRNDPRKRDYAEFYKTYDAEKSLKRMIEGGWMQSATEY